jgi:hypothetical protein
MDFQSLTTWIQWGIWLVAAYAAIKKRNFFLQNQISLKTIYAAIAIGLLLSSLSLYFNYRPRIIERTVVQTVEKGEKPRVIVSWGAGDVAACAERLDLTSIVNYTDKFEVTAICGIEDASVDRFEDQRITISSLRTIIAGQINVVTPLSKEMLTAVKQLNAVGIKNYSQWNEVVLLPKGTLVSDIHKLSDVHRYQGKILGLDPY